MQNDLRRWITLIEGEDDFDGYLYHATAARLLAGIQAEGIDAGSYWGTLSIVSYYAEGIEEEGDEPVIIKAPMAAFDQSKLAPDQNGIEEPLTHTLGMTEEDVWEQWEQSAKTWRDSLDLIGSVKYQAVMTLPPAMVDQ